LRIEKAVGKPEKHVFAQMPARRPPSTLLAASASCPTFSCLGCEKKGRIRRHFQQKEDICDSSSPRHLRWFPAESQSRKESKNHRQRIGS